MNKKGAIEFSMTTIMVIIVGVVVLSLGIAWVMGSFEQISDITDTAFESAKEQLGARLTSQEPMGISPSTVTLNTGKSTTIAIGYLNSAAVAENGVILSNLVDPNSKVTFVDDNTAKNIGPGETFTWKVVVNAGTSTGQTVVPVKLNNGKEKQLVVIVE